MSNVAKLKKQAAEFELKKQFDKALAIYVKMLESFDQNADELDVALFNRVGDLMLRQGNVADAVDYYEKAVDHYADTGFFNNAIALCNKILRHSPGRASVYYKLGKISAQKGFRNDAKVNFLEYADRMQKAGKVDEAFRALTEFADLCPDQDEIRLMLADQLTKADRKTDAIEQLQILHERYDADGRTSEAAATVSRMRAIDPKVEPRAAAGSSRKSTSGDLIFIDLDTPSPSRRASRPLTPPPTAPSVRPVTPPPQPAVPEPIARVADPEYDTDAPPIVLDDPLGNMPLDGIGRIADDDLPIIKSTPSASLLGLQSTNLDDMRPTTPTPTSALAGLESTSFDDTPAHLRTPTPASALDGIEHASMSGDVPAIEEPDVEPPMAASAAEETIEHDLDFVVPESLPTPAEGSASIDLDLSELVTPPAPPPPQRTSRPTPNTSRAALEGLPLMDLEVPRATPQSEPRFSQPPTMPSDLDLVEPSLSDDPPPIDPGLSSHRDTPFGTPTPTPAGTPSFGIYLDDTLTIDGERIAMPTPSSTRKSTLVAAHSVEILKASVEGDAENWSLHRELAEAMLEAGDRQGGIAELELAMAGAERSRDLELASSLAEEIARLEPDSVKHHQKRVEFAFLTNDRSRLIEAYVSLADTLLRGDQADKARVVYQRVLDLAPDDIRARSAIDTIPVVEPEPPAPPPRSSVSSQRRPSVATPSVSAKMPAAEPSTDSFVNLGDWLRDSEAPKDTRMVVDEQEPTGDEDADFADMLRKFKQGVAENVDAEDYQSHYDLAIAFKEMGLLDEAIAEFQKALGSPTNRLPTYEALGQCFMDKSQFKLASSILARALNENASEEKLVGVLYLLGRAAEAQGNVSDALGYYQRVFVLDIQFRDIADRLSSLERAPR
jgi:tetratricopeptide (TPR) repeat protein